MNGPFVIVGMHRSGTSLVSRILDRSGVFMGLDLQEDHESKFFIKLNKWIYENAGADWARPMALQELMDYEPAKEKVEEYVVSRISSNSSKKYSGKSLKKGLFELDSKWGWKDSKSPIRRGQRAATLSHAFDFWTEHMEVEKKNLEECEFVLEVRYEDLLTKPKSAIKQIWNFIDIERDDSLLEDISQSIDGSRAYAYKKDEEMRAFALENSEILEIFGYLP